MTARDPNTLRANWRCVVACGLVTLSPFQYGVDFGLIGGLQAMVGFLRIYGYPNPKTAIGWNITPERQQLISSLMTLGAFISSFSAGFVATKLSRRYCLWAACVLCIVSNVMMMVTEDIGVLYAGRFLIGLANGFFMTFSQLYLQESSPAKYRGFFLAVFNFSTSVGSLVGYIVDWATAPRPDKSAYLIPLGVIYIVPAILMVGMFFIPESPRWLVLTGRVEEARKALLWLRPDGADVDIEVEEMRAAVEHEKELGGSVAVFDMFKNPIDRRRTFIAVCGVLTQAASGSFFIISYKAYFLSMAKVANPFGMSCVLSAAALVALIANAAIVVRYGRRRVLLTTGLVLCGVFQLINAIVYDKNPGTMVTGQVTTALVCLYMMSFNALITTYAWLTGGEIPSQRLRSYTFGFAAAIGFLFAWVTSFTAPYFINPDALNWGPRYGYIWFPSCIIAALWVFIFLPEVKGRTLEEIDEMFEAKLPARKFRKYECISRAAVVSEKEPRKSAEARVWEDENLNVATVEART